MFRAKGVKSAKIIQVIEIKAQKGIGIEKDPVREVTQYWDLKGNLLAEIDNDPQYLADLCMWESNRLKKIIEDWREAQKLS